MPVEAMLHVVDDLVPQSVRDEVWAAVCTKRWYFGNQSVGAGEAQFWKMDLDGDPAVDALLAVARPRCESLAQGRLHVLRQYANGHTYGLGGQIHTDDVQEGHFTLLYYPMPVWEPAWGGETVYHHPNGDIALAVLPRPGRTVFFDSRIPHAGRAPNRSFGGLRVTVACKLRVVAA